MAANSKNVVKADPKGIFGTAEVYLTGASMLANRLPDLMFPWVMCSAFSLELYLKCLILVERGTLEKGHDLADLFSKTTPESQKAIRASYESHKAKMEAMYAAVKGIPAPKTDFDYVLHISADAFVKFRYAFEQGTGGGDFGWSASPISECVRGRLLELHPDWRS
ncbi:MAG: hypothetical protein ABSF92_09530 [Candidatus Acidiferrales bacterium]|jgi:hypothetical protein